MYAQINSTITPAHYAFLFRWFFHPLYLRVWLTCAAMAATYWIMDRCSCCGSGGMWHHYGWHRWAPRCMVMVAEVDLVPNTVLARDFTMTQCVQESPAATSLESCECCFAGHCTFSLYLLYMLVASCFYAMLCVHLYVSYTCMLTARLLASVYQSALDAFGQHCRCLAKRQLTQVWTHPPCAWNRHKTTHSPSACAA